MSKSEEVLMPAYASRYMDEPVPKHELPEKMMPSDVAYQLIHDELLLDGRPPLNLASFVTTWMESEAVKLMQECLNKNLIDHDEYPFAEKIQERCVKILAHLFHANDTDEAIGTATLGSSEAIMLAGLAMKTRWQQSRPANKQPTDKPNIVMGANVQVVWEKFARYFDVEPRYIPLAEDRFIIDPKLAMDAIDENTIGLVAILGSTFTGEYEPIAELNALLEQHNENADYPVPMHVDAASGGFVAPFANPDLQWDFRLSQVASINVSGHKYGLVYPGVGWVLWRDAQCLPHDLIFYVNYLGGEMPTFNLNFSGPSAFVVGQYYNFLRLGREGYTRIIGNLMKIAHWLADAIAEMPEFVVSSQKLGLPVVAWQLKPGYDFTAFDISKQLRQYGWIVPAYSMPANAEKIVMLRVVVREGFSLEMANDFVDHLHDVLITLQGQNAEAGQGGAQRVC